MKSVSAALVACPFPFGELCDVLNAIADTVRSVADVIRDPFLWLLNHLFPQEFLNLVLGQLQGGTDDNHYARLYRAMVPAGTAIAAISASARVVRTAYDDRYHGAHAYADNLLRFVAAILLLAAPTPTAVTADGMPVGWQAIRLGINASLQIGKNTLSLLSSPAVFNQDVSPRALIARFVALIALSATPFGFFFAIILLAVGVGLLYMAMIMILRSIMLAFAITTAPLCIATAVFDARNRFFQWWSELFVGALCIPVVLGFALALTAGFALQFDVIPVHFLTVTGILLGGMWFTGKAVHQLTWRHFSHGGVTGALTALSTTAMALPNLAAQAGHLLNGVASGGSRSAGSGGGGRAAAALDAGKLAAGGVSGAAATGVPLAAVAAQLATSAAADDALAAAGASSGADFGGGAARGGGAIPAGMPGAEFNRAVGAAIGRFASTPEGEEAVRSATSGLPPSTAMAERVSHYAEQLAAGREAVPIAQATVASLMGGALPDLAPILGHELQSA
ncbi:MAG TPA: hypothetical protein VE219_03915 [Candidatus Sulfotelmatobacter sp.]|nr:hypothetical protein [Candidatus Sulfotelmatobacter sp.]